MIKSNSFRYFRTSSEVIQLAMMMYVRFNLSLRNDLLHERGIDFTHETVRFWWNRFGPMFAHQIRKRRIYPTPQFSSWRWHLDEVFVKINGELHYLWRAVDHEGEILESYVTKSRNKKAALAFIKKLMKRYGTPHSIVTDKMPSYKTAMKEIGNSPKQYTGRWQNNRVETSHLSIRRRENAMYKFRLEETLQKFTSVHSAFHNHFNFERHIAKRDNFKAQRDAALAEWRKLCVA